MGWFSNAFHSVTHSIGHGLTQAKNAVGSGLTKAGHYASTATNYVGSTIVPPVYKAAKTVTGQVFDHVVKPVAAEGMKFAKKGEAFVMANVDTAVNLQQSVATAAGGLGNFATNVEQGVGGFLGNLWSYVLIGEGVLADAFMMRR